MQGTEVEAQCKQPTQEEIDAVATREHEPIDLGELEQEVQLLWEATIGAGP